MMLEDLHPEDDETVATDALERADDLLMRGDVKEARSVIQDALRELGIDPRVDHPDLRGAA